MKRISIIMPFYILAYGFSSLIIANKCKLVNIQKISPTIRINVVYATKNNFTGQQIYSHPKCYVHSDIAKALDDIQQELRKSGLGLLIWDAYRPLSAQRKMWSIIPDECYVADPRKGGRHTRGTAVDVTLISLIDHSELEMPTEFDNFTSKAWIDSENVSDTAKKNRMILKSVMEKHGFIGIKTEWWHFDWKSWKDYPVLEVELKDLE